MYIEMEVDQVIIDPFIDSPSVILKEKGGDRILVILIGYFEALAILSELEKISLSRPLTHDLIRDILSSTGINVEKVEIYDLIEDTYYASLCLSKNGQKIKLDCRPSDAIAIALRTGAKIYVKEEVIRKSEIEEKEHGKPLVIEELEETELKEYKELIENIAGEDYYKWKM